MPPGGAAEFESIGSGIGKISRAVFIGGGGRGGSWKDAAAGGGLTLAVTAFAGLALAAAVFYTTRSRLKSPWALRKRKNVLSPEQWRSLFTPEGKLCDKGVKFLKKVRSGGVDPSIRAEVWPFLLGLYDPTSSKEERDAVRTKKRKQYDKLRRRCCRLLKQNTEHSKSNESGHTLSPGTDSPPSEYIESARQSLYNEDFFQNNNAVGENDPSSISISDLHACSGRITDPNSPSDSDTTDSYSFDHETSRTFNLDYEDDPSESSNARSRPHRREDFATWQRIIRLDAVRANDEWISYDPSQAASVSNSTARRAAEAVGLSDCDHLGPARIFHAARLVAILEAYAFYDPEIGYCQGMSDLLSPIVSVMTEDHEAFWCFVCFMKKARHNFRLDEMGIRRQLSTVSRIIKHKDPHLYRHLEKLEADDCFFVYRMVVVLFRRELTFEQTLCLWEVIWADQAAIRAGLRIRQRAPPTDDLLLYAIAASVLQRRKRIIERHSSMDEILRECNAMAGHVDVWKLLDDAHELVVTLHEKMGA